MITDSSRRPNGKRINKRTSRLDHDRISPTYCLQCNSVAIKCYGFDITEWNLDQNSRCANCGYQLRIIGGLSSAVSEERFLPVIN